MRMRTLLTCLLLFFALQKAHSQSDFAPLREEEILNMASVEECRGVLIVHLRGTPYEMGYQHGALLKEKIRQTFYDSVLNHLASEERKRGYGVFPRVSLLKHFRRRAAEMDRLIPANFREELTGLAEASGLDYADVLLMHAFLDISSSFKGAIDSKFIGLMREGNTIFICEPAAGNRFVSVGCAGLIGALWGMNEMGITAEKAGYGKKTRAPEAGVPILILLRQALQYSDSMYDGIRFFSSYPRAMTDAVIIGDMRTHKGCIVDFNTKNYLVRFEADAIPKSINYFLGLKDELGFPLSEEMPSDPFSFYDYEKGSLACERKLVEKSSGYERHCFSYPSAVETDYPDDIVFLDFYEPRGQDSYPAVVFLTHLAGGAPQIEGAFCRELASNGIAALLVQTAFQKNYKFSRTWVKEELGGAEELSQLLRQLVIEARRGIDWLETLPKVEKDRIGIIGISLGGIVAPVVAGVDERIKSMAVILGGGDTGEIIWHSHAVELFKQRLMKEDIKSAWDLERRLWKMDPLTFAFKAKAKPSVMINAHFDADMPKSSTIKLWHALERPKLIWVPTGHYTSIFTIGYARIKILQHFYESLMDRHKARGFGVDYIPGAPFERFRLGLEGVVGPKTKLNISGGFSEGVKKLKFAVVMKDLFNTPYFGGSEIFGRREKDERYKLEGAGGAVLLGRRLSEHTSGYLKYSYETVNVYDVQQFAPSDFHRHIGRKGLSIPSVSFERNTLDDSLYPIDGSYRAINFEAASRALGGSFNFLRTTAEASWYITIGYPKFTFVFRVKGGWMSEYGGSGDVPFFERFYVGDSSTVRGYRSRLIGPRDGMGLPLWGEMMAIANAEMRFPIYKGLNGAFFFDSGSAWEKFGKIDLSSDFKSSVGAGLRYRMDWAVVRLDYGYPLDRDPGDPNGKLHLTLGLPF